MNSNAISGQESLARIENNELLNEISKISGTGGWIYDVETKTMEWTDETYHIYGIEIGSDINVAIGISHYPGEYGKQIETCFNNAIEKGIEYQEELRFINAKGEAKWIRTTGKVKRNNGKITHIYGAFEDITREKELIAHEQNTALYLETIINNLNDAIVTVDEEGTILSANRTVERIFKCQADKLIGQSVNVLMPQPYASLHHKYMKNYLKGGKAKILGVGRELPAKRFNGEEFPMELSLSEVNQGGKSIFIGIIRDITEQKEANEKIYQLAYFDPLTQLPNRLSFEKDLTDVLIRAKLAQYDVYCGMLDIDRFSQINLIYGKQSGDYVLNMMASRIQAELPKTFRLYRNMADSFFLLNLLPISSKDDSGFAEIERVEKIIQSTVSDIIAIKANSQKVTLTIGSLCLPSHDITHEKLIQLLEFACHKAKIQGKGCRVSLRQEEQAIFERQTKLRHSILNGIANEEFFIVLQPQFTASGELIASEALLRWKSSEFGMVSPDEFIDIAENNGDIVLLGDWVINEVCKVIHQMNEESIPCKVAINISGKQVVQPNFCSQLKLRLNQWNVAPSSIVLEITESTLVKDVELVRERMIDLSNQGFRFSIDDFGTGYSSLSYLKELPIHELKIDRYFIEEIEHNNNEIAIVNTIIEMARALGVYTVAEGIETPEQLKYLAQRGCNYFQGFMLSKPLPVDKWKKLLKQTKTTKETA
ncbi:EAL domain-containing protein [Paraneptunicella aestuarii]|uniref:sensor domain-containing protein n=1 Tax=Paraneptunicella aestuarii TaxID=2831148 RepID=UPI001E2C7934|nr:EAL domain-containing protein [Paraneptunicella aestuarii]UAA38353.1 EAL domain-containing protein [Paraneptunicella aestuarii]